MSDQTKWQTNPNTEDEDFQNDIEKAIALSLESARLDEIKRKNVRQLYDAQVAAVESKKSYLCGSIVFNGGAGAGINAVTSGVDTPSTKPRPRPDKLNLNEARQNHNLIAPPPIAVKQQKARIVNSNGETDLIQFTNSDSKPEDDLKKKQISEIMKTAYSALSPPNFTNAIYPLLSTPLYSPATSTSGFPCQATPYRPTTPSLSVCPQLYSKPTLTSPFVISPALPDINNIPGSIHKSSITAPSVTPKKSMKKKSVSQVKCSDENLIDLTFGDMSIRAFDLHSNRKSVLDYFDPLMANDSQSSNGSIADEKIGIGAGRIYLNESSNYDDSAHGMGTNDDSISEKSFYEVGDPFEYMYSHTLKSNGSDRIYDTLSIKSRVSTDGIVATGVQAPPLPPRKEDNEPKDSNKSNIKKKKKCTTILEKITVNLKAEGFYDGELIEFVEMVQNLTKDFQYQDKIANSGLVISPTIDLIMDESISVKLVVHHDYSSQPILFTCNVDISVEHIISHVLCQLEGSDVIGDLNDYVLQVWGLCEYLSHNSVLQEYEYVHQCIKYDQDVYLKLIHGNNLKRIFARKEEDDAYLANLSVDKIYPMKHLAISFKDISILLETLDGEIHRVKVSLNNNDSKSIISRQGRSVVQAVKAICMSLGGIETPELTSAIDFFLRACSGSLEGGVDNVSPGSPYIIADRGDYAIVALKKDEADKMLFKEQLSLATSYILETLSDVIAMYCRSQNVDFELSPPKQSAVDVFSLNDFTEPFSVKIASVHNIDPSWNYDSYGVTASLYHGTKFLASYSTHHLRSIEKNSFFDRIIFNEWLDFQSSLLCTLPRETRIVLSVVGLSKDQNNVYQDNQLGWAALQLFSHNGVLVQGMYALSLWPDSIDKRVGPAPHPTDWYHDHCPCLVVSFSDLNGMVCFPEMFSKSPLQKRDINSLDDNTQQLLMDIVERDTFTKSPPEDREVLWEKRHYLHDVPQALPKVLLAAHSWDWASLTDLHGMVRSWCKLDPIDALQLLLPCFPDREVRSEAISWIKSLGSDELVDYLPQLVQALKYETYDESAIAKFLLERSLTSPALAHHLFWLLSVNLDNRLDTTVSLRTEKPSKRRIKLMFGALKAICGESLRVQFKSQQELIDNLDSIAGNLKNVRDAGRPTIIQREVACLDERLSGSKLTFGLPLKLSYQVKGLVPRMCSYFTSNTLPLKLTFKSSESPKHLIHAIYKIGDDLRQDMLTLQMIRIMDKLWLKEGIDLKIVTFGCIATGDRRGMIEMVEEAETLRKIQTEYGVTGSFKDRPLNEWLAKHNPAALDFEKAVQNFTLSCAGYCVATYVLGICDRHNDNIMLRTSGHLFHIDFGKFLGDSQMFGNFKRDRTPFVLTPDMAYVINGGDKPSERFQIFVDLCCQAFNILRRHGNLLLNLFALMISSEIPGVTLEAVNYIQSALLPELSNAEAAATFTRMIEESLKSWFTQVNFFLHNLAQLRFTGDATGGSLLSFIPKTYSETVDGRIKCVRVYGYQKRYDPEKYYVYILSVVRENQPDPSYLFRSYREFCEFHQKLCVLFPLAKYHSLPKGRYVGRSNIKQVAEKRKVEIEMFLSSLFKLADEIAHSDIVYTFFHPLLRDQEEANIHLRKYKEPRAYSRRSSVGKICGSLRLSLLYERGALQVMVEHARDLATPAGQLPSSYVKVYLLPDPLKLTKRKTKVVKKCTHPTFMEMLEYRMPLEVIELKVLQATIWNYDPVQENEFLGSVTLELSTLDLDKKHTEWYSLSALSKR